MCKPSCAVWGLPKEEVCPDCLLDFLPNATDNLAGRILLMCQRLCPPFRFLRLLLSALMRDDVTTVPGIVDLVREMREFYPPCSYEGGVAHSFRLDPQFVEVSK